MTSPLHIHTELRLAPPVGGDPDHADLIAFAEVCAARIARGLRGIDAWEVYVAGGLDGRADAVVRVQIGRERVEARASACDPAHAIWDAMCEVEQPIRHVLATARAA